MSDLSSLIADLWQPIETAPKDGRDVLACFIGQFDRFVCFVATASPHGCSAPNYGKPTHWMPLPSPPRGKEDGTNG